MVIVFLYLLIAGISGYYLYKSIKRCRKASLKIWELDGVSKIAYIGSGAKELQEILSCPTCAVFPTYVGVNLSTNYRDGI